jgi:hypothetical protein
VMQGTVMWIMSQFVTVNDTNQHLLMTAPRPIVRSAQVFPFMPSMGDKA